MRDGTSMIPIAVFFYRKKFATQDKAIRHLAVSSEGCLTRIIAAMNPMPDDEVSRLDELQCKSRKINKFERKHAIMSKTLVRVLCGPRINPTPEINLYDS